MGKVEKSVLFEFVDYVTDRFYGSTVEDRLKDNALKDFMAIDSRRGK